MLTRKQESAEGLRSCKLHVLYSFTLILFKDIRELSSYSLEMVWKFGISYFVYQHLLPWTLLILWKQT